jgi:hypothetical protein
MAETVKSAVPTKRRVAKSMEKRIASGEDRQSGLFMNPADPIRNFYIYVILSPSLGRRTSCGIEDITAAVRLFGQKAGVCGEGATRSASKSQASLEVFLQNQAQDDTLHNDLFFQNRLNHRQHGILRGTA